MSDFAVLIVAYRRGARLNEIFEVCVKANVKSIYISLDGARGNVDFDEVSSTRVLAESLVRSNPGRVFLRKSDINMGAARSVIAACNWAFENEDFIVILEDDCVPSIGFFEYAQQTRATISNDPRIFLASGSQFAPKEFTEGEWKLSKYPLIWGWMTSKSKWQELISKTLEQEQIKFHRDWCSFTEYRYWKAGNRRALSGFIDAWDIPIAMALQQLKGYAILPAQNLVTNVGQDIAATHTTKKSVYLEVPHGTFINSMSYPLKSGALDSWYKKNFYRIRFRHLFSTLLTQIMDYIGINSRVREPLHDFIRNTK